MATDFEGLSSVHKAIRILRQFSLDEPELGISDLAKRLGYPKSTVARLVQILCAENMLQQNEESRKYHLSLTAFEIGSIVYHEMELCQIALPLLKQMLPSVQGAIQMMAYDQGGVVCLLKLPEDREEKILHVMGKRTPAHCTASGKVMLAFKDEEEISMIWERELRAYTPKTITEHDKLRKELQQIKQRGYAVSFEEFNLGMYSVAVPVFNDYGHAVAAISVIVPYPLSNNRIQFFLSELQKYSRIITEQLGLYKPIRRKRNTPISRIY